MKNILCYGDSNTYGYKPDHTGRYDRGIRWPSLLSKALGEDFRIIENGVCGRTTALDDPFVDGRNGLADIDAAMQNSAPVKLVILMLGTNDFKRYYGMTAKAIAANCGKIIDRILSREYGNDEVSKVLLVSPILLDKNVLKINPSYDSGSIEASHSLAVEYEVLAKDKGCYFLRGEDFAKASPLDCEHMDETGHKSLALAIEENIKKNIGVN